MPGAAQPTTVWFPPLDAAVPATTAAQHARMSSLSGVPVANMNCYNGYLRQLGSVQGAAVTPAQATALAVQGPPAALQPVHSMGGAGRPSTTGAAGMLAAAASPTGIAFGAAAATPAAPAAAMAVAAGTPTAVASPPANVEPAHPASSKPVKAKGGRSRKKLSKLLSGGRGTGSRPAPLNREMRLT